MREKTSHDALELPGIMCSYVPDRGNEDNRRNQALGADSEDIESFKLR